MTPIEHLNRERDKTITVIKNQTWPIRAAIDMAREMDLLGEQRDLFRKEHGYYKAALMLQEAEDAIFAERKLADYTATEAKFGSANDRWKKTVAMRDELRQQLIDQRCSPAIIDCRAKSALSIWHKMQRFPLEPDEIFDLYGIRITTWDESDARIAQTVLLNTYQLMRSHKFKHMDKTHLPVRDTLVQPTNKWYAAINMNLAIGDTIAEVQITTRDAFRNMHTKPDWPIESIIQYK